LNWPYIAIALPMSVMLFIVVFVLEYFWDYEKDIKQIGVSTRELGGGVILLSG
jgi:hypothetical protein